MYNSQKLTLGLILSIVSSSMIYFIKPCILQNITSSSVQETYTCATLAINMSTVISGIIFLLGLTIILLSFFQNKVPQPEEELNSIEE